MKLIAQQDDLKLYYSDANASFCFILYKVCHLFTIEVCRGRILGQKFSKFLSQRTLDAAHAKLHAIKYVSHKFKA